MIAGGVATKGTRTPTARILTKLPVIIRPRRLKINGESITSNTRLEVKSWDITLSDWLQAFVI